jgi:hypothetical protein
MSGGTIYGSDTPSRANTAPIGAAIYVSGETAKYDEAYGTGPISTSDSSLPPDI